MRIKLVSLLILMALDILSGFLKVKINHLKFKSEKMASGLYKKTGTLTCLLTAYILQRNFSEISDINLFYWMWIYVVVMEAVSIFENCANEKMIEMLKKGVKHIENK